MHSQFSEHLHARRPQLARQSVALRRLRRRLDLRNRNEERAPVLVAPLRHLRRGSGEDWSVRTLLGGVEKALDEPEDEGHEEGGKPVRGVRDVALFKWMDEYSTWKARVKMTDR